MNKEDILLKTEAFIKNKMKDYDSGHDWWHIVRVRNLAGMINSRENLEDPFLVEMAALLHDYSDSKFAGTAAADETETLRVFLMECTVNENSINRILNVMHYISFSSRNKSGKKEDVLLDIIQDADRLDAIGAIGIARAFNYGGFRNNRIYSPDENENKRSTIRHFDDKLLLLKSLMNTVTARQLAETRHKYMEDFLSQFHNEWNLSDF